MASKVAKPAQIQPKSQFLFHKNLAPRDFSIMTLLTGRVMISNLPTIFHIKDGVWRDYGNKKRQINNLRDFIKHKKWENIEPFYWFDPGKDVFRHMDGTLNKIACCSISTLREPPVLELQEVSP